MTEATRGHLAMLLFSALVAGSFSLGVQVANDVAPIALMAARFLLASVALGLLVALRRGFDRRAAAAPWRYLVLGGLYATYFVLMFEGLKTAAPVSASAVFTLTPVMSGVFGYVILRQITTPRMAFALAIGAAGALWVIFRADLAALIAFEIGRGEAVYFFGCIAHALYIPMVPRLNRGEPVMVFTFGALVAGFVLMAIIGWNEIRATDWLSLRPLVWIALAYLAVFASAVTMLCVQYASFRLPGAKVMAYTYLTPSWVILWEMALGNAPPPLLVLAGVGLTFTALVLLLKDETARSTP